MSEAPSQVFHWWTDFFQPFIVPAAGAGLAIVIKHFLDARGRKRNFGVSDTEFLCDEVQRIRRDALVYWSRDGSAANLDDKILEASIMGTIHGCLELINNMSLGSDTDRKKLSARLNVLREVCTSGSFGQLQRQPDSQRLYEIEIESRAMISHLLTYRRR